MSALHSAQTPALGIHVIHAFEYANAAARTGATGLVSGDVGKAARQVDAGTFWVLTNHSPVTWAQLGGGGGGSGDVVGPVSSTDNALVRFDGATGKVIQDGAALLTDGGVLSTPSIDQSSGIIIVPVSTTPAQTAEGSLVWDSNDDVLTIGTGASRIIIGPSPDLCDIILNDHFVSGNPGDADEFGSSGWRTTVSGTGAAINVGPPEPGRPGIARIEAGTAAAGRAALHKGDATVGGNFLLNTTQGDVYVEWLQKFTGSVGIVDLEFMLGGWGQQFAVAGDHTDGIYVKLDPVLGSALRLVTASGGSRTTVAGTTAIVLTSWYRIGIGITYPGGVATVQLYVNGVAEGAPITTNIPTVALGFGWKMEAGASVVTEAVTLIDYVKMTQITNKET